MYNSVAKKKTRYYFNKKNREFKWNNEFGWNVKKNGRTHEKKKSKN